MTGCRAGGSRRSTPCTRAWAHRHFLRDNIREFVTETGSEWGKHLLENFEDYVGKFWLVKPKAADINQLLSRLRDTD